MSIVLHIRLIFLLELLGYTKAISRTCSELNPRYRISRRETLDEARKMCDNKPGCTGIYQPECEVEAKNATKAIYINYDI